KPASLRPVFGLPCQTTNLWRIKILAQWCRSRHDEPPGFAMLNLTRLHLGIAHESQFQGLGISSTERSTPASPIARSRPDLPTLVALCFQALPATSASSSPTRPRSGAK